MHAKSLQSCPTLCNPMNCSLAASSVYGILQARILEWIAIPFSRGSSQPRDWTWVSCIAGRFFTIWATREAWWAVVHEVTMSRTWLSNWVQHTSNWLSFYCVVFSSLHFFFFFFWILDFCMFLHYLSATTGSKLCEDSSIVLLSYSLEQCLTHTISSQCLTID